MTLSSVRAPNELTSEQLKLAEHNIAIAHAQGVFVGAMLGPNSIDVRPLLLEHHTLKILRCLSLADNSQPWVLRLIENYAKFPTLTGCLRSGIVDNLWWQERLFFQKPLLANEILPNALTTTVPQLIALVNSWEQAEMIHGHLCISNVMQDNNQLQVVDFGFALLDWEQDREGNNWAPELKFGDDANITTDIYGLGFIIKSILGPDLASDDHAFIERMLQADPHQRPSMAEIQQQFKTNSITESPSSNGTAQLRLGRVLSNPKTADPEPPTSTDSSTLTQEWLQNTDASDKSFISQIRTAASQIQNDDDKVITRQGRERNHLRLIQIAGVLLVLLLVLLTLYSRESPSLPPQPQGTIQSVQLYQDYWQSGVPSKMKAVALAAVRDRDPQAELIIVTDALDGNTREQVRSEYLRIAFNPAWEAELSEIDRQTALRIALARMIPSEMQQLPELTTLHPGVLLPMLCLLSPDKAEKRFGAIPVKRLTSLPQPYGPVFQHLNEVIGAKHLNNLEVRVLAGLFCRQNTSLDRIQLFFNKQENAETTQQKLLLLLSLPAPYTIAPDKLYQSLELLEHPYIFNKSKWFTDGEANVPWSTIPGITKLQIVLGFPPSHRLPYRFVADLLRHPTVTIREYASEWISRQPTVKTHAGQALVELLSSPNLKISRTQSVALLALLNTNWDTQLELIPDWLKTEVPVPTLMQIILARHKAKHPDPITLETARYLSTIPWTADLDLLQQLSQHPEPLIRAQVYVRLDPLQEAEHALLVTSAAAETNEKLRKRLELKLQEAVEG